jgi:hypothetical protein
LLAKVVRAAGERATNCHFCRANDGGWQQRCRDVIYRAPTNIALSLSGINGFIISGLHHRCRGEIHFARTPSTTSFSGGSALSPTGYTSYTTYTPPPPPIASLTLRSGAMNHAPTNIALSLSDINGFIISGLHHRCRGEIHNTLLRRERTSLPNRPKAIWERYFR